MKVILILPKKYTELIIFRKNWVIKNQVSRNLVSRGPTVFDSYLSKTVLKWMSLYKRPLYDLSGLFFAVCMFIFHKTEVLTVILRCLTGLTHDWFKSYDTKRKYFHFFFLKFCTKTDVCILCFLYFCVFCHNFCTN